MESMRSRRVILGEGMTWDVVYFVGPDQRHTYQADGRNQCPRVADRASLEELNGLRAWQDGTRGTGPVVHGCCDAVRCRLSPG